MTGTHSYQCSNCGTLYRDIPGRHGPPIPHPKSECLPLIRQRLADAEKNLADAKQRLARAESQVYA
jgi:hypothetical protein